MYRVTVGVFVFVGLISLGIGSPLYAQNATANFNNCPTLSTYWVSQSYKIANYEIYPAPYTQMKRGAWTFTQNPENNCLFTAERIVQTDSDNDAPPYTGDITIFTGAIYGNGTKIILQARPRAPNPAYENAIPDVWQQGEFTKFDKRNKKPTEIQYIMNVRIGDTFTTAIHAAESGYGVMVPYTP